MSLFAATRVSPCLLLAAVLTFGFACQQSLAVEKPNIVFIFSDDHAYQR